MKRRLTMLLASLFLIVGGAFAQTEVNGVVVSQDDNQPIVGATIQVAGTSIGTVTDINGRFTLDCPTENSILRISFVGMEPIEIVARRNLRIVLKSDNTELDEIIVTGYGVTRKSAFTGAASTVGSEVVGNKTDANPIKALEGAVTGLQLNNESGQPGAPANIFIRGRNSLNSGTQPLYVVDGVTYNSDAVGVRSDEGQETSPLANLNANDIESITVLKDATATSIYGARAANGVIVITTKKGGSGATKVSFNAKVGWQFMPGHKHTGYHPVNAEQYKELWTEAIQNEAEYGDDSYANYFNAAYGLGLDFSKSEDCAEFMNWFIENDSPAGTATDWLKEVTRTALTQNYNLNIQGGGRDPRAAHYFLSLDYLNDEGIVIGKDMKRYSFRFNFDQAPSKIVKYGFNTNFVYSETNMGAGGGYFTDPITQAFMQSPWNSVKTTDGEWNMNTVNGYNPVALRSSEGDQSLAKQYRAILSPYVTINFLPELFYTMRAGADVYVVDEFGFWSFLQPQGRSMNGMGENNTTIHTLMSITNTLNYLKTFNMKHNVNIMLGQEAQYTYQKNAYLAGSNYPVQDKPQVANTSVPGSASTYIDRMALSSWFGNAEYNYDNKYYLSASLRADGSSRFGKNNRWATFYSVGAKYRLTEESFMESTRSWLNNLTFRISYGTSGNSEVGNSWYAAKDLFGFGYNYNGIPGMAREQFGNDDLKWEKTGKFNVGLDMTFLNRFTVELDYYSHLTSDMVFAVPTSFVTGLDEYYQNVGELSNRGFEATLRTIIFNKKDLKWNVSISASHNKNEVKKLSTDLPIESTYQITEVGYPIYQFKMKEFAGVDPETGSPMWYLNEEGDETTNNWNKAKKRYVGDANPKWFGAISSNLEYKNFDFSFQFNYSLGGKIYGSSLRYDEHIGASVGENFTKYVYDNRWQKPGDVTDVPKLEFYGSSNKHSTQFLMSGNYLKLRSIVLGYSLPSELTKKFYVSRLRFYVQADNLFVLTAKNYRGFDPSSVGADGVQWWNYPSPRNVVFGVNVDF